jgi:cellulose biosynthesis protein BcsQ
MIDLPQPLAFLDSLTDNPFLMVVVIAFLVGVAAPWLLWAIWIGPKKAASKKALRMAERESERLLIDLKNRQADNDNLRQQQSGLLRDLEQTREQVGHSADRERRVLDSEGRMWEQPVKTSGGSAQAPRFRPLEPRKPPIICLMNLKGGVGKTTIAANLGATMASLARDVMLVDLDFQGSLTALCLNGRTIQQLRDQHRFVQIAFGDQPIEPAIFRRALMQIGDTSAWLLGADEDLYNCEEKQQNRWIIGASADDVRFRLRALLHSEEIQGRYDAILLDCPPRLTTASINALAASDFVLIPTLLDAPSVERVPSLLAWLRRLKDRTPLCSNLNVLGVVANQVQHKNELTPHEQQTWSRLQDICADRWGDRVHHFATTIPRREAFPRAAERNEFAAFDRELVDIFRDLVKETDQAMPAVSGAARSRG